MEIKRGDVFLVDLNPVVGAEQAGIRPALVIQIDKANAASPHTVIIPFTTFTYELKRIAHVSGCPETPVSTSHSKRKTMIALMIKMPIEKRTRYEEISQGSNSKRARPATRKRSRDWKRLRLACVRGILERNAVVRFTGVAQISSRFPAIASDLQTGPQAAGLQCHLI